MKRFTPYILATVLVAILILSGCGPEKGSKNTIPANADLSALTIDQGTLNPPFAPGILSYTVNLPSTVETVTITGSAADPKAKVSSPATLHDLEKGIERTAAMIVIAQNGAAKTYTIKVTRVFADGKAITAFAFTDKAADGVINETDHTIAITVPPRTDLTALTPTITYSGVSIDPAAGTEQNFTTPLVYTVTAEDGTTQAYTVTVTVELDTIPPAEVTALTAEGLFTQAILNWIPPADEDFAGVEITASPEIPLTPTVTLPKGTNTATLKNLVNGISYTFTVKSFDQDGNKSAGITVSATPGPFTIAEALVPGAVSFPIGENDGGVCNEVNYPYYMAKYEVTYQLWKKVYTWATAPERGADRYSFQNQGQMGGGNYPEGQTDQCPVTMISWGDALVWCNALTEYYNDQNDPSLALDCVYTYNGGIIRDAIDGHACANATARDTKGFRLPTSMEWELAARYQNGVDWTPGTHVSGDLSAPLFESSNWTKYAWSGYKSGTNQVGQLLPNALDIYDMSGNVWEWCFTDSSYGRARGGSWYLYANQGDIKYLQVGVQVTHSSDPVFGWGGFRPVRTW